MMNLTEIVGKMRSNPSGVRFADLCKVCDHYFGQARQSSGSHRVCKTPWIGDPRVNTRTATGRLRPIRSGRYSRQLNGWRSNMARKNDKYTYRVTWSEDDAEYVGLCAEFSSLSWLAQTPEAALKGIRKLVGEVVADMQRNEESVPEPIAAKTFSGKFMVRVPPDVHRQLAIQAAEAGVSLNRLASAKLSH